MHITALSRDGFEKEISRVESKRNLFNFIRQNYLKEIVELDDQEQFHWIARINRANKTYKKRLEMFLDRKQEDLDEVFAYEGIFDQKEKGNMKPNTLADRSRMEASYFMGTFSKSRIHDVDRNMSNTLNRHGNSQHSMSRNSEHSNNFQSSYKNRDLVDSKSRNVFQSRKSLRVQSDIVPTTIVRDNTKSRSLANIFIINNRKVSDSDSVNLKDSVKSRYSSKGFSHLLHGSSQGDPSEFKKKLEGVRSHESRINLYASVKQTKMSTLAIPNAANSAFPNTSKYATSQFSRPSKIKINYGVPELDNSSCSSPYLNEQNNKMRQEIETKSMSASFNPLYPEQSTKEKEDTAEVASSTKTVDRYEARISSKESSEDPRLPAYDRPTIKLNTDEKRYNPNNDVIVISGIDSDDLSQATPISGIHDADNNDNDSKHELGIINEESMSQSASYYFSKPHIKEEDISDTKIEEKKNNIAGLLVPKPSRFKTKTKAKSKKSKTDLVRYKTTTMNTDTDMIDLVSDLNHLSASRNDLKKIDEEFSKLSEESKETLGSKNSKVKHSLKSTIKNISKLGMKPQTLNTTNQASRASGNQSNTKSISSISIHSSINVDPDEKRMWKRTQTNMIPVNSLSDYKFDRFPKRTITKGFKALNQLNKEVSESYESEEKDETPESPVKDHIDSELKAKLTKATSSEVRLKSTNNSDRNVLQSGGILALQLQP